MDKTIRDLVNDRKNKSFTFESLEVTLTQMLGYDKFVEDDVYEQLVETLNTLINEGVIKGRVTKGRTAARGGTYKEFSIITQKEELSENDLREIRLSYHPLMQMSFYVSNAGQYKKDYIYLKQIDAFLKNRASYATEQISKNQRSYEIFLDEKFFSSDVCNKILKRISVDEQVFNYYETYEPFFYYSCRVQNTEKKYHNALIVENSDTFYSIKRMIQRTKKCFAFADVEIDLLIYGEGNKINRSIEFIEEIEDAFKEVTFYYFGDMDFEGFSIPNKLMKNNPQYKILPASHLYQQSLKKIASFDELGFIKNDQRKYEPSHNEFLNLLDASSKENIIAFLSEGKYIPEENLTELDLMKWLL